MIKAFHEFINKTVTCDEASCQPGEFTPYYCFHCNHSLDGYPLLKHFFDFRNAFESQSFSVLKVYQNAFSSNIGG